MDQTKNCIREDKEGDMIKQETHDLVGLLSSPDSKPNNSSINVDNKSELNTEFKDMIHDDKAIKQEPVNPLSIGKLPNGDVNTDVDNKVGPPNVKPLEKVKQESNGNPHTPVTSDNQAHVPVSMGPMQHRSSMSSMFRSPMGMGPHMGGPSVSQEVPMGQGPGIPNHQAMISQMGPGSSPMMGPNGGLNPQQEVAPMVQQQNEIFVFTTQLANEAARAVQLGQYKNMLSYHMDQPATKNFLQKNPKMRLSAAMFCKKSMKCKMGMMNNAMGPVGQPSGESMGCGSRPGSNTSNSVAEWVQQQNQNLQELGLGMNNDPLMMMNNPNFSQMMMDERMFDDFGGSAMNSVNLMQSKVPNDNLTPEQLQRREDHLASLRKMQQMLFPEQQNQQGYHQGGPGTGPGGPGPGGHNMVPGDMAMYQQTMSKRAMMSQQNVIGMADSRQNIIGSPHGTLNSRKSIICSPHGMMDSWQEMTMQEQFLLSQGMLQYGPGPQPQHMQILSPAQREWIRLQQEYITEKQSIGQQRQGTMGLNGPKMGPDQPPPSYYVSIAQKQRHGSANMDSPSSPGMNGPMSSPTVSGMNGPMGSPTVSGMHGPMGLPTVPGMNGPMGLPTVSGMNGPVASPTVSGMNGSMDSPTVSCINGPMGSPTVSGMNGSMGLPTVSASDVNDQIMFQSRNCKNSFSGMDVLGPIGPGAAMGPGGMDSMMQQQGSPLNHNMGGHIPGNLGMKNSVSLQRAGNPEQYVPEMPAPVSGSNIAAKPPPSYTQSQSTKRKRNDMEDLCKNLQPTPSPQHISYLNEFDGQELTITKQINTAYRDTNTNESQLSLYTQNDQMVNSPLLASGSNKRPMSNSSQTSNGPLGSPGPVTVSQGSGQGPGSNPMSGANVHLSHYDPQQQTPQNSSSISNSPTTPTGKSSLSNITSASLANLAKGVENLSNQMQQHMMQGGPFHGIQLQSQQQQNQLQSMSSASQGLATPQSSQYIIQNEQAQSVAPISSQTLQGVASSVNNAFINASSSIQQVNIQSVNHGGGISNYGNNSSSTSMQVQQMNAEQMQMDMQQQSGTSMSCNMTQSTNMVHSGTGMHLGRPKMHPGSIGMKDGGYGTISHPIHSRMSPFAQTPNLQQVPSSGHPGSPGSMRNANVQIQPKAPNTIEYLPANQSTMLPDLDFMNQFANPMVNMEEKVPTSKRQYFPGGNPYGPGGMGPGMDFRMGPSMGMCRDPRYGDRSMSDPRIIDPRMSPSIGGDPRMGPMGPGADLHMGRHNSRMGSVMGMGADPRMGPAGMSPMSDPRIGPTVGSIMGPTSGHMSSMRPESRGSPFTGPIGPAVQQSMMMRRGSPDLPLRGPNFSPNRMDPGMSTNTLGGPLSSLSAISGNPMTSLSSMSNSIMADPMCQMGGAAMDPGMCYNGPPHSRQMSNPMMSASGPRPMSMQVPSSRIMQSIGMGGMPLPGPYSQQPSPGLRMSGLTMGPGPLSPGAPAYSPQFQQFQQQLYSQSRSEQMSPMDGIMGNFVGPGYGHMGQGMSAGMMNMHGPM